MNMDARLPPQNREAERAVLGSILRWPDMLHEVGALLSAADFYQHGHQVVFGAMLRLAEAGKAADLLSVGEELRAAGEIADAPPVYLAELFDSNPTGGSAVHYAGMVKETSTLRRLIRAATDILRDAHDRTGPASQQLESAERAIFSIADTGAEGTVVELGDEIVAAARRVEQASMGKVSDDGLSTGLIDIDAKLRLRAGELTVVGARPGVGKSALGLKLLRSAMLAGACGFFASLEMRVAELADRLLASETGIESKRLKKGKLNGEAEWVKVADAQNAFVSPKVFIDDTPTQRAFRIAATGRRLKLKHGIGLVVVDYLQLVEPEDRRVQRYEQVGAITRRLKVMARELAVPVVAMAQVGRGAEERSKPRLSDLRESGDIEAHADNVLLMHKEADSIGTIEVIVAKQRNGPTGEVTLAWEPHLMRFSNFAVEPPAGYRYGGGE